MDLDIVIPVADLTETTNFHYPVHVHINYMDGADSEGKNISPLSLILLEISIPTDEKEEKFGNKSAARSG